MLTTKQLEQRHPHFGASEIPQALGLLPWKDASPTALYHKKLSPPEMHKSMSWHDTGNWLEIPLIQSAVERLGSSAMRKNLFRVSTGRDNRLLSCTLDATLRKEAPSGSLVKPTEAIEAKYVGPDSLDGWGEDDTDQVPSYVAAQVQAQMYVAELDTVWVSAFLALPRPERRLYHVPRDDDVIEMLVDFALNWWAEHIILRIPPTDAPPPIEILRAMRREPKTLAVVKPELVEAWTQAHAIQSWAKRLVKRADHAVLAAMGNAEAVDGGPAGLITYFKQSRKEYSVPATTLRVLRPKGIKRAELKKYARIEFLRSDRKRISSSGADGAGSVEPLGDRHPDHDGKALPAVSDGVHQPSD